MIGRPTARSRRYGERVLTAHHEAGHFVVATVLAPDAPYIAVSIRKSDRRLGFVEYFDHTPHLGGAVTPANKVVISYAGFAAETHLDPRCARQARVGATNDYLKARSLLRTLHADERSRRAAGVEARRRARELVATRWRAIEVLAQGLLEWDVARMLIDLADGKPFDPSTFAWFMRGYERLSGDLPEWLQELILHGR